MKTIFLAVWGCLITISLFAQTDSPAVAGKGFTPASKKNPVTGTTRAVVIGISDYQDEGIPDLNFADKDAEAFANFLRSPAGGSLDQDHLQVLTNQNATAGQMAAALDWLLEQSKEGDQAIIYFSGHGDVERKTISQPGFLLCWDSPARIYMGGGTFGLAYFQEIVTTLSVQNKAKVLVITDACHAGKLAGSQIGGAQITGANLSRQYANEVKILSCQPDEFSLEGEQWGGGRGVFSYHLVEGLFGLADQNADLTVTVGELDRYLEENVTTEAAPQSQVPILLGNKAERLARVDVTVLSDLKKMKAVGQPFFATTESRGLEDEVLSKLDSSIVKKYLAFKLALKENRFFEPADNCAEVLYASLSTEAGLAPLYGFMKRNYAAALQDGAQQVFNTMLKTGLTLDILKGERPDQLYRDYPVWLDRAAQLLGTKHYMYAPLQARKAFFEGKIQPNRVERRKYYHRALHWQPDLPHAYVELIPTCSKMEVDSAVLFAKMAMEIAPSWVVPYVQLSVFYLNRMRDTNKADSLLRQALSIDSNSIFVWYNFAGLYQKIGDDEKTEYWLKKTVSSIGEGVCFPCAHLKLGYLLSHSQRNSEAEHHFNMALQLDPSFHMAYNGLGTVYRETERYAEAEKAYQKEIDASTGKDKAPSLNEMGNLFNVLNQMDKAVEYYKQATQADSTHFNAQQNLISSLINTNKLEEAEQVLKKMARMQPEAAVSWLLLGAIGLAGPNPEEAEANIKKGMGYEPESLDLFLLACTLSRVNQIPRAIETLDAALKMGFDYYEEIQDGQDAEVLRAQPEWKVLMKKYFPDKVRD